MACNPEAIISALYEERENVRDIVFEEINVSDRMMLRKIPDGGTVERHSNQTSVIYNASRQASMAYRQIDHSPRDLESGQMEGRNLAGRNGVFDTNVNDVDDNACHGYCTIQFGQGYRERGFVDYQIDLDTPEKCVREFDRQGGEHLKGYFRGFRNQFSMFGLDNFSDNLINLAILNGEANASVVAADRCDFTPAGFNAPPQGRISIPFLIDYRDRVRAEMKYIAMPVGDDWKLEVEMPMDDWFNAVEQHNIRRHGMANQGGTDLARFNLQVMEDPKNPMYGREFMDYGKIRCYFNEEPVRGFFKPTGTSGGNTIYEFVRVYDWLNEVDETGGIKIAPNHDYREDRIQVGGIWYDMVTLIPHVDPRSFTRFGLVKPFKPQGEDNLSVNYDVKVVDGAYLANNKNNDRFQLIARHEFRFKTMYPEISGFIAYRHSRDPSYLIDPVARQQTSLLDNFASPEDFRECDLIDEVTSQQCAECDEVPTSEGDCIASGSADDGVLSLDPCPSAFTTWEGDNFSLRVWVRRTGELAKAATVDYATANGSATAGTHYTDTNGSLAFAAGEEFKYVDIPITGGSGDVDADIDFTLTISNPGDATIGCAQTLITIEDLT